MDIELVVPDFTNPCAAFGEPIEVVDEDDRLIVPAEVGARELGAEAKDGSSGELFQALVDGR